MAQPQTRTFFTDPLRELEADSLRMGSLVLEMVSLATRVVLEDEDALVDKVLSWEVEVDRTERSIVERVIQSLADTPPEGDNLRFLSSTLFLVNELEKIGDEATKLTSRSVKLQGEFPYDLNELLREMSTLAQANLRESLRLYSQYSQEAAQKLVAQDDAVDLTFKTSRNILLGKIKEEPDRSRQLIRCLEIFHALEHVSDRAADIAKRLQACYGPFVKVS